MRDIAVLLGDATPDRTMLIEYLHRIQDRYGCISMGHMAALAEQMRIATAEVFEVATFYHHFRVVDSEVPVDPIPVIRVCESITCQLFDSERLFCTLDAGAHQDFVVEKVPCVGRCAHAPVAVVERNPIHDATPEKVLAAVKSETFDAQLPSCMDFTAYVQKGGYELFKACINGTVTRTDIINTLKDSRLRGLGGAGFPAGNKWEILRQQPSPRLLAVNIDEGEPGTFKDRHYLEQDPHRFLEGMLIAAWVIESEEVYIYLRDEYAAARAMLERELSMLKTRARFPLPRIVLRRGAGAYVCGEESAMIESIEGKRGMPRLRPPYVAQVGLFGRPTLEHNMETLYWVRDIIERGAAWFASQGRNGRSGVRSFSVSGRVRIPGVHLAPAGITLLELIDEFCGGMSEGHTLYGYFPGGASGGMLPAAMGNIPLDFDTLNEFGCFIGSAAIIVFSQHDRARDLAANAMRFFRDESCGQCTPCRVGTAKAAILMEREHWDAPLLQELATTMSDASICGLGQAAPNPLLCALRYFPNEF